MPGGVRVIKVYLNDSFFSYVGVKPGSFHSLRTFQGAPTNFITPHGIECDNHKKEWILVRIPYEADPSYTLYWSPEINKQTPTITDY